MNDFYQRYRAGEISLDATNLLGMVYGGGTGWLGQETSIRRVASELIGGMDAIKNKHSQGELSNSAYSFLLARYNGISAQDHLKALAGRIIYGANNIKVQ